MLGIVPTWKSILAAFIATLAILYPFLNNDLGYAYICLSGGVTGSPNALSLSFIMSLYWVYVSLLSKCRLTDRDLKLLFPWIMLPIFLHVVLFISSTFSCPCLSYGFLNLFTIFVVF